MLHRPLQQLNVSLNIGPSTRPCSPWAVLRPRPRQHLQVPAASSACGRLLIPLAPVRPRPLQQLQVPFSSGDAHVHSSHGQ